MNFNEKLELAKEFRAKLDAVELISRKTLPLEELSAKEFKTVMVLYEDFKHDKEYLEGDRFIFEDELWEVIADHTSTHYTPPEVNYWYVNVSEKLGFDSETGEVEEWPEWVQPTGYENTYKKGAKVTYEGKRYILEADSSSHSPTTPHSGWQLVED